MPPAPRDGPPGPPAAVDETAPRPVGILVEGLGFAVAGRRVLADLDLRVEPGETMAMVGRSGSGKTSLIRILAGLAAPTAGRAGGTDGRPLAGRAAWMGQQDLLFPWLSALDNVAVGARLRGEPADRDRALDLLARVGLADRRDALPAALSGGMRQRVAIARTLYEDRPVVLMDEPFSALDAITRTRIQDLAAELLADRTVLLITHDPQEACRIADRLVVLGGRPARASRPERVPGTPPRAPDDPRLLAAQGRLVRDLLGDEA